MHRSAIRALSGLLVWSLACSALLGCEDDGTDVSQVDPDVEPDVSAADADVVPLVDLALADATVDVADLGVSECVADRDCANPGEARGYCEMGLCKDAPAGPFIQTQADGVTRAGVAAFDITPEYLERWTDRAGPECPDNQTGVFDGRGECRDGFEDADGDGQFDAIWLGGGIQGRAATGVNNENPPSGRVLVLSAGDTVRVIVTYDLHAIDAARVNNLQSDLALRLGVGADTITIHVTGSRHGPDAVGLWGPGVQTEGGVDGLFARVGDALGLLGSVPYRSGVDSSWWRQTLNRTAAAVRRAGVHVVPVAVRSFRAKLPIETRSISGPILLPDADEDGRRNDTQDLATFRERTSAFSINDRLPAPRDAYVYSLSLEPPNGGDPIAVLMGWAATPAYADAGRLSAGFPGRVRQRIEAMWPTSKAIWLGSAGANDTVFDERVWVPAVSDSGQMVDEEGRVVDVPEDAARAPDPIDALARILVRLATHNRNEFEPVAADLVHRSRFAWVPLRNPRLGLAGRLGVMEALGAWLSGREVTQAWSSGTATPACGGLGCIRYRLERLTLGETTLVFTPGGLADGYLQGQQDAFIDYADGRELRDLDGDAIPDDEDPEIRVSTRSADRETIVTVPGPLNPSRFEAINGLASRSVWVVGRSNGGLGTLGSARNQPNVFEGSLSPLLDFVRNPENGAINVCAAGYPCSGEITLQVLTTLAFDAQPSVLADIPGTHEVWLESVSFDGVEDRAARWYIEAPDGAIRASGERLELGPSNRVFLHSANLNEVGVRAGDLLVVERGDQDPFLWTVGGLRGVELASHPNAGDAFESAAPDGGDIVYNIACDLIFDDFCPHRRALVGSDPNTSLPREP